MNQLVDQNWTSAENKKREREIDLKALEHMKVLEIKYSCLGTRIVGKTPFGYRTDILGKKKNEKGIKKKLDRD